MAEFRDLDSDESLTVRSLNPLPVEEVIVFVMGKYLGHHEGATLQSLNKGCGLMDLPLVDLWIQKHRTFLEKKPEEEFFRILSHIVADILAVSLIVAGKLPNIEESNNILLRYVPSRTLSQILGSDCEWQIWVEDMFRLHFLDREEGQQDPHFTIEPLINWALKLAGHDVGDVIKTHDWVASSFRGQVLIPFILLSNEILPDGSAALSHFPGILMLETQKDRPFSRILSKGTNFTATKLSIPITSAQTNGFPNEKIKWELSSKAENLEIGMGWTLNRNMQRPFNVISALMGSIMIPRCPKLHPLEDNLSALEDDESGHPHTSSLAPGSNCLYEGNSMEDSQIAVYPLYGNEWLKLLALASTMDMRPRGEQLIKPLTLINRGACINCVLKVCGYVGCSYVIL